LSAFYGYYMGLSSDLKSMDRENWV
jgi:hypothetical protein